MCVCIYIYSSPLKLRRARGDDDRVVIYGRLELSRLLTFPTYNK